MPHWLSVQEQMFIIAVMGRVFRESIKKHSRKALIPQGQPFDGVFNFAKWFHYNKLLQSHQGEIARPELFEDVFVGATGVR